LKRAMIEAARAAARSKGTYSSAQYARIARRRGPNKAAVALSNSMLNVVWHLLTNGELYQDLGADYFKKHNDPEAQVKRLAKRIEALGFEVTVAERVA
jgi:transposase